MKSKICCTIGVLVLAFPISAGLRDGLEPIEPEVAKRFGKLLSDEANKIEKPQIKITPDADKSSGVHVPHKVGALIVPQKELKFDDELFAKFKEEKGAAIAYLFLYHLTPVVKAVPADASRVHTVKLINEDGQEHLVHLVLLSVRHLGGDDYRLYAYGHDEKPLIDARFAEGTGPGPEPTAVEIKDVDEQTKQAKVVVTVFGKYQASFQVAHSPD